MAKSLYQQLKDIGIDDELAHNVDKALDPAHVATKEDVAIMQETILQTQLKAESRYHELRADSDKNYRKLQASSDKNYRELRASSDKNFHELKEAMTKGFTDLRVELHRWYRHTDYAFGAILVSMLIVLAVNIYFHL